MISKNKIECPSNKILNPKTMRCVLKTGAIGKKLLLVSKKINDDINVCPSNKILNPKTMRCVLKSGAIGIKLLKELQIMPNAKTTDYEKQVKLYHGISDFFKTSERSSDYETPIRRTKKQTPKYLNWEQNSCYIDSLFVALFHNKSKFIEKEILNAPLNNYNNDKLDKLGELIRLELIRIYKLIAGLTNHFTENNCSMLRKYLNKYYKELISINPNVKIIGRNDNWTSSQNDPFDIFELLTYIFKFKNTTKLVIGNNQPNYTNIINSVSVDSIFTDKLYIKSIYPHYETTYQLDRSNYYIDKHGNKVSSYKTKIEILKAPMIFIRIPRNMVDFKIETPVIPTASLKLAENENLLYLNSIIIHYGDNNSGHYISLIKKDDYWYEYDDLSPKLKKIGNLENIIKKENYVSNIVGLIYS